VRALVLALLVAVSLLAGTRAHAEELAPAAPVLVQQAEPPKAEPKPERLGFRPDAPAVTETALPRFRIFATKGAAATAALLAQRLEADRDFIARRLGSDYPGVTEVRVGEGTRELMLLDVPGSGAPQWAAGLAHPTGNLMLFDAVALRRDGGIALVRHELAHVALGQKGGPALPRWFHEGFAVLEANEWSAASDLAMVRANRAPLPLASLEDGFPAGLGDAQVAYAESASFVEHLFTTYGVDGVQKLIAETGGGKPFDAAFRDTFGDRARVEADWLESIKLRYNWIPVITGSGTLFSVAAVLLVVGYGRHRRRRLARLAEMEMEDRALEAAERIRAAERTPPAPRPQPVAVSEFNEEPAKPTLH
jgi:hypothetical protein